VRKQAFSLFYDEIGISVPSQTLPKGAFRVNAPFFVSQVGTDYRIDLKSNSLRA